MKDEISVSVTVSRPDPDDPLELDDPANGFEIVAFGPGQRLWRRSTITSEFVHGRELLGATLDTPSALLILRILGEDWVEVRERLTTVLEALSQEKYLITETIESAVTYYVCEMADMRLANGDDWNKFEIMADQQTFIFTIPYHPTKTELP